MRLREYLRKKNNAPVAIFNSVNTKESSNLLGDFR